MEFILEHKTNKKLSSGFNSPQGATLTNNGINFALFSQYARQVYLLLFDKTDEKPTDIIKIEKKTGNIWHVFVHGLNAGQLYAFKVDGKYDPKNGFRFNSQKTLVDPYAKAVTGKFISSGNLLYGFKTETSEKDLSPDDKDNTHITPKSVVIDDFFDWQNDSPLNIPLSDLIIYEVHLKGFTAHKTAGVSMSGTYLGFVEKISYLKELGVNAVEFLPIHEHYTSEQLIQKKLTNYWGYNTIGFFAPEWSYSSQNFPGCQVTEFKTLVRELHKAGIEVILDVVYNHTGEENELGPTICFRGIDNQTYYGLQGPADQPYRYYRNNAGTGNILNIENPQVLRFILDSLRYWVEYMHVDGFRFDLTTVLGLKNNLFNIKNRFFQAISRDPVLKKIKLIAEPWDLTTYQLGNFPKNWAEWNDKFRDSVRRFWGGEPDQIKHLAWRLTGSQDIFDDGRKPAHSINFVTCHDGFSLNDLYTYNSKHNEKNGEKNRDGSDSNFSLNFGIEGETKNVKIIRLRKQMVKNAICSLMFSLGTPMILAGDEMLRTQRGNNNAYCQDNDISWLNWDYLHQNQDIFRFFKKAILFRKQYSIFRKNSFFTGKDKNLNDVPDVDWFDLNLNRPDWNNPNQKLLSYILDGGEVPSTLGAYFLFIILNSDRRAFTVKIPQYKKNWFRVIDTSLDPGADFLEQGREVLLRESGNYISKPRSFVLLIGKNRVIDSSYFIG